MEMGQGGDRQQLLSAHRGYMLAQACMQVCAKHQYLRLTIIDGAAHFFHLHTKSGTGWKGESCQQEKMHNAPSTCPGSSHFRSWRGCLARSRHSRLPIYVLV